MLEDYLKINDKPFSIPRLAVSITPVLTADKEPADTAYWLARTIGEQLLMDKKLSVSRDELLRMTHIAITRYSPEAGLQYGLKYRLIKTTASPRRGRPSFKPRP